MRVGFHERIMYYRRLHLLLIWIALMVTASATNFNHGINGVNPNRPLIIAHRGSSGVLPEHTQAAYERGIEDGADIIECDLVLSRDLVPICNHDLTLDSTTNVADLPQFADKKTTYSFSGQSLTGWFPIDFDLDELKSLRRRQDFEERDQSHNGKYQVVTLDEHIEVAQNADRVVGIYPELKAPAAHNMILQLRGHNTTFEDVVLEVLKRRGYTDATHPCFIQCFEEESLKYMKPKTDLKLVINIDKDVTNEKLKEWGSIFYGIGCWKEQIIKVWTPEKGYKNWISGRTDFVRQAHNAGLKVHVATFRNEDKYLAWNYGQDGSLEYDDYLKQGVDGYITDFPATLARKLQCGNGIVSGGNHIIPSSLTLVVLLYALLFISWVA